MGPPETWPAALRALRDADIHVPRDLSRLCSFAATARLNEHALQAARERAVGLLAHVRHSCWKCGRPTLIYVSTTHLCGKCRTSTQPARNRRD